MKRDHFNKSLNDTVEHIKEYINLKTELYTLLFLERFSKIFSKILLIIISFLLLFFVLFFLSFAFVHWYEDTTGNFVNGYLIVALFYLLIGALIYIFRKHLFFNPIIKGFTTSVFEENEFHEQSSKDKEKSHETNK